MKMQLNVVHILLAALLILFAGGCTTPPMRLYNAALIGDNSNVRALLDEGVDINYRAGGYEQGATPLMAASQKGHIETVTLLLLNGADVNARTDLGETALYFAVEHPDIVTLLLYAGADTEVGTIGALSTPLHLAASRKGLTATVKALIEAGADVDRRNALDLTPLIWASMNGNTENVKRLLDAGADFKLRCKTIDITALSIAKNNKHKEIVRLLEEAGATE